MLKSIIFDFDGVLLDTMDFHLAKLAEFMGKEVSREDLIASHDGNFFASQVEFVTTINWIGYRDFITTDYVQLEMKKDIVDMIDNLKDSFELFVITSGGEKNVGGCLKNNGLLTDFDAVMGRETCKSKKEKFNIIFNNYNLTPSECLFVTDTLGDVLEANEVGVKTVAVDFGYHDRKRLVKGNPWKIISSFDEIKELIR